ncbi:ABC transporter ATP-binding protein/permease [Vagococcus carniphilus]|uniref:ABC transporter ATP-binding protein/permease n=1 Tax=Vagococcus carniphilus TaxID=218144 RepID=A0AAW8U411_9ENTE|nr:ABC transporter ATP-binding protein/permease [Vagococcus carniphilus]MDT2831494.1 ABC transporter ATP-binding protein/permease [Vagococcus carniphilus]MDT2832716.1 ABC transporter ATP-binding protein/permease [Vagococcus carniphilus]MDT2840216.1 ABC transporter ATP-binding protein/permease [Vagococcus carniphilus]MDT2854961.1 ABC transporter ATP-binding protein/permease [Vagococcus carniphilus]
MIDKRLFQLVDSRSLVWLVLSKVMMLLFSIWLWLTIAAELTFLLENQTLKSPVYLMSVVVVVFICKNFFIKRIETFTYKSSAELRLSFRESVMKKAFKLGSDNRNQLPPTKLSQLMVDGVEQLEIYYARFLPQLFYCGISSVIIFIVLANYSIKPAIALLICMPMIPIVIMVIMKIAKRILKRYWDDYTDLGVRFHENLMGLSVLKAFDQDKEKQKVVEKDAEVFRKSTMALLSMQLNSITVMDIISYGGAGLSIGLALLNFSNGSISIMGLLMFILLSAEFFIPMRQLGSLFHVAMNGISASDELFSYLELEEPEYGEQNQLSLQALKEIACEEVGFTYDTSSSFSANDINVTLKQGTFTAVIGKSGSGKSTLVKLLSGELKNTAGHIYWNEEKMSSFSRSLIEEHMMVINNHSYLYGTTIRENLLLGNPSATEEMLWDVLKQVRLEEFVKSQAKKLDTPLTENGQNLSGGQRQRLILARALLKKCDFYIFDEITSGIDIESENYILEVIKDLAKHSIVLFISHRLYNVVDADHLLVMEAGQVVEQGSPNDLVTSSTYFKTYFEEEKMLQEVLDNE